QRPGDDGGALLAGDVAGVERRHRLAHAWTHLERRAVGLGLQPRVGLLVRVGHQYVGAIDDVLRRRRPAVARARLAVVARGLGHQLVGPVGHAAPEAMARGELARLAAGAQRVGRRMRLLQGPRPDRDLAVLEVAALPAERLPLGPRLEDQLHALVGALARL